MIEEFIFSGKYLKLGHFDFPWQTYEKESSFITAVEDWMSTNGSDYLKLLYDNDFYYFPQFIKEYFNELLTDGWKIFLVESGEEIEEPKEEILRQFLSAKEELSEQFPFKFGTPKLFLYGYYSISYQLDDRIAIAKRLF